MRLLLTGPISFLACFFVLVPTASLGLAVPTVVVMPMAMALGASFSGVAASWAASIRAVDGSRSRLLVVVGWTELGAVLMAGVLAPIILFGVFNLSLFAYLLAFTSIIACCATVAALQFRSNYGTAQRDIVVSLYLLATGFLVLLSGLLITCSTGACVA